MKLYISLYQTLNYYLAATWVNDVHNNGTEIKSYNKGINRRVFKLVFSLCSPDSSSFMFEFYHDKDHSARILPLDNSNVH